MERLLYTEINAVGLVMLVLMYINFHAKRTGKHSLDQWLFELVLIVTMLVLIFDTGMWLLDGQQFPGAYWLNRVVTQIYFILNPAVCFCWMLYCDYKVNQDVRALARRIGLYVLPLLAATVITSMNPINGWVFCINEANVYTRGPWMLLIPLLSFSYVFAAVIMTIVKARHRQSAEKKDMYRYLILFPIFPVLGTVVQLLCYGLSLMWICTVLALLMIFINLQNRQLSTDWLTGLYNRRYMENSLQGMIRQRMPHSVLFLVMIDVDDFKQINDHNGHAAGDEALQRVADILRYSAQKNDLAARLGGDEFVLIGQRTDDRQVQELLATIQRQTVASNAKFPASVPLSFSFGYAIYDARTMPDIDHFLLAADAAMYLAKAEKTNRT